MPRPAIPIYPGPDVVRRLYVDEQKSLADIAAIYGVTKPSVSRWLKQSGVASRSISEATLLSGKYGVHSEAHRETLRKNIAVARTQSQTPAAKAKWREKMLGREPPNKGKAWTPEHRALQMSIRANPEHRAKLAAAHTGENAWNWRGGVKTELARRLDSSMWRRLRIEVYERDNWRCRDCGCKCLNTADSKKHPKRKIQAHHVISRRNGGTDELANLVTLCMSCHHKRERRYADALFA